MVEVALSEDASDSKSDIDLDAFVTDVLLSGSSDGEEMHGMKLKPAPADNDEEDEDEVCSVRNI